MGLADTVTKAYMKDNSVFADAFNYLIYGGEAVVDPKQLQELDTTEIALPFGSQDEEGKQPEEAVQKYRDSKDKKRLSEFLTDNPRMLIEANAARVIKAVTNTPLDIPEGAEVIDVCKAVEEMMNESEERGELRMLVQLVRDGDLKLERAAEKAKMTVEQFEKVMENTPLQAV